VALDYNAYRLLIPANTLQTYGAYEFSVLVSSVDAALTVATASVNATFVVRPSTPIAVLAGTQYRSLAFGEELTLDASSSFDVDHPARGSVQLAFFWPFPSLTAATPVTAACQAQHDVFILTWTTLSLTSPLLLLPSCLLCVGLEYTFAVVVAHASLSPGFEGAASATTFTVVRGDAEPPPPVANTVLHALAVSIVLLTRIVSSSVHFLFTTACGCRQWSLTPSPPSARSFRLLHHRRRATFPSCRLREAHTPT
jgi:hypothetical protein